MLHQYIKKILQARVYDVAIKTPLETTRYLSLELDNQVLLKREDMQPVFSFKLRGAYNKIIHLSDAEKQRGIITASAGNHAQGVALSANKLGIKAIIVMPKTTPHIKVRAVAHLGGQVELHGNTYDEASQTAKRMAKEKQLTYVHPYDDLEVIAGQGTIAMEILQDCSGIDAIFVPVGGGGLIAGIAAYVKYVQPEIKIIGVEPDDAACLKAALAMNERVILDEVGIFVDGVAVQQVGELPFALAQHYVDEVICVNTDAVCAAIKDIFDETRTVAEPAGALALAGLKAYVAREQCRGQKLVSIVSGANINFDRLQHVSERTELGSHREVLIAVTIPEQAGSFLQFCHTIGNRTITEFNYRYADSHYARVFVGVRLIGGIAEKRELLNNLQKNQYQYQDLSDNEAAKLHVRHMVGGHATHVFNERVYRFQFPERPGALLRFLRSIGTHWNISLFHYRNHGAAYGRILVGIQIPDEELDNFADFIQHLGFRYWREDNNPAYQLFLS